MKLPSDNTKYSSQWRLVEVAKYVKSLSKVIREKVNENALLLDINEVEKYSNVNSNIRNIHVNMALRYR